VSKEPSEEDQSPAPWPRKARKAVTYMPINDEPCPMTAGFSSLMPEDADHVIEVCREQDPIVHRPPTRLEPEHYLASHPPRRTRR
jgi:hypothetical protein